MNVGHCADTVTETRHARTAANNGFIQRTLLHRSSLVNPPNGGRPGHRIVQHRAWTPAAWEGSFCADVGAGSVQMEGQPGGGPRTLHPSFHEGEPCLTTPPSRGDGF